MFQLTFVAFLSCSVLLKTIDATNGVNRTNDDDDEPMPTFTWDASYHREHNGQKEMMRIKFPDNGPDDFIMLKHSNPLHIKNFFKKGDGSECIFSGPLKSNVDSAASVTGCAMDYNNLTIVLSTNRLKYQLYTVKNHIVEPLDLPPMNVNDVKVSLTSAKSQFLQNHENQMPVPFVRIPRSLGLYVAVAADRTFKRKHRNWQVEISKLVSIATPIMEWQGSKGIGSKIVIKAFMAGTIRGEVRDIRTVENWAASVGGRYQVFMALSGFRHRHMGGRVRKIASVCHPNPRMRAAVVYHHNSNSAFAGETFAHELGHALGAFHDFMDPFKRPKTIRHDSRGRPCTNIGGIMDYRANNRRASRWSTCSREFFRSYYIKVMRRQRSFCMKRA